MASMKCDSAGRDSMMDSSWHSRQEVSVQELLSNFDGMPTGFTPRKGGFGDTGLSPRPEGEVGPLLSLTPTPLRQRDDFSSLLGTSLRLPRVDSSSTPSKLLWSQGPAPLGDLFTPNRDGTWRAAATSPEAIKFPLGSDWEASPLKVPFRGASTPLKWDV